MIVFLLALIFTIILHIYLEQQINEKTKQNKIKSIASPNMVSPPSVSEQWKDDNNTTVDYEELKNKLQEWVSNEHISSSNSSPTNKIEGWNGLNSQEDYYQFIH